MSEYQLNTSALMIPYSDYMDMANEFLTGFKTSNGNFTSYQRLPVAYDSLSSIRQSIIVPGTVADYITGVRIGYALNADQIILYFVPVYGVLKEETGGTVYFDLSETSGDLITIINEGGHEVYQCINGELVNIMDDQSAIQTALNNLEDYRENIRIVTPNGERGWNSGDVKSVFYPFQEIEALHDQYGGDHIFFTSVAELTGDEAKHSVDISHLDPVQVQQSDTNVANFSSLCPPSCNEAFYPVS